MKILIMFFTFLVYLNSSIITGSQDRVSVTGGSIIVTGTKNSSIVNSGEITFINEEGEISSARQIKRGDLTELMNDLKAEDGDNKQISLTLPGVNKRIAYELQKLYKKYNIPNEKIIRKKYNNKIVIKLNKVDAKIIKKIYPAYHKKGMDFINKTGKVPGMKMSKRNFRIYHKKLLLRYGGR
jgi:hypothetical protein